VGFSFVRFQFNSGFVHLFIHRGWNHECVGFNFFDLIMGKSFFIVSSISSKVTVVFLKLYKYFKKNFYFFILN
jgi:hypothetical protein